MEAINEGDAGFKYLKEIDGCPSKKRHFTGSRITVELKTENGNNINKIR